MVLAARTAARGRGDGDRDVNLPLKDVHPGLAPAWWPPAPGWWLLAGVVALASGVAWWWMRRRRQRRAAILRLFEETVDAAGSPAQQVAAMSDLLRRAARRKDPLADRLQGDDWLRFLDRGMTPPCFEHGPGALLRAGAFRRDTDAAAARALRTVARQRYLAWMLGK
jgi:hypothetical protein